ncbi:hypothetical protein DERP_007589 [Dermatophagoides pteronyssinus]|uniref:Uncharacterized protein n=1 Tax=Dermatophagoides pteronyssinus TaxID=6956 RepID=A0ABQ8JK62_DERPT|nr:hypothetical protein DERP_007589 [Dermatophagoides pteronyssinus]
MDSDTSVADTCLTLFHLFFISGKYYQSITNVSKSGSIETIGLYNNNNHHHHVRNKIKQIET